MKITHSLQNSDKLLGTMSMRIFKRKAMLYILAVSMFIIDVAIIILKIFK